MPSREEILSFWEDTRAALARVNMAAQVEPAESSDPFMAEGRNRTTNTFHVRLDSFEGRRIRAWLTLPDGLPPAHGWPAIVNVPGYAGTLPLPTYVANYGYALLTLFPRGQGESLHEWEIEHSTKLTYHVTDRERYYYRGVYMDCVRGVDFLCSREDVDSSRIGIWGASQGGGLSLATAALDRRIVAAVAGVPWLCSFPIAVDITANPYVELHNYVAQHPHERAQVLDTLAYFDQVSLAGEITCPTLIASALTDEVHPLRTVMPVFEQIRALKSIVVYPDQEHAWRVDFNNHAKAWMDRYLR